jgi:hypothetical protein
MAIGTLVYTYTVGNMFSIIMEDDEREATHKNKLATLETFAENIKLPQDI